MLRGDVIDGVQAVFAVAAPLAALGLLVVLLLEEVPLRTGAKAPDRTPRRPPVAQAKVAQEARS